MKTGCSQGGLGTQRLMWMVPLTPMLIMVFALAMQRVEATVPHRSGPTTRHQYSPRRYVKP